MEKIVLHDVEGFTFLSGIEGENTQWIEFETDSFSMLPPSDEQMFDLFGEIADELTEKQFLDWYGETCSICEKKILYGWICLDDSSFVVCSNHIEIRS